MGNILFTKKSHEEKDELVSEIDDLKSAILALREEKDQLLIDLNLIRKAQGEEISLYEVLDDTNEAKEFEKFTNNDDPFIIEIRSFLLDDEKKQ